MAAKIHPAFDVDRQGLAAVFARKGKAPLVIELIQNVWDEAASRVDITLEVIGKGKARLVVEDDNPEGFKDLAHAYTLFAPSLKKGDPSKRGRFNLGEKLVIATCDESKITTTKGTVVWTGNERRHLPKKRPAGSIFEGIIAMTEAEVAEVEQKVNTLLVPKGITTTFNLKDVKPRKPVRTFETSLRTEKADEEGRLTPTTRKTKVEIYEPRKGETPHVYELGIPVVECAGDRFHVNVCQKVPVPLDRDNLPPAYLRHLRVEVLNNAHDLLDAEDAKAAWVTNAMEDERVTPEAADAAFKGRFGNKTVVFDPNNPEANKIAAANGYAVVPGGALPKAAWANVKSHGIVLPAGQVTPSPTQLSGAAKSYMDPDHYPVYVENVVAFAVEWAKALMGIEITVRVATDSSAGFHACYGDRELTLNLASLGHKWFEVENAQDIMDLLFDEYAHEYAQDHLDRAYYRALRTLGAKAVVLAFEQPEVYERLDLPVGVVA